MHKASINCLLRTVDQIERETERLEQHVDRLEKEKKDHLASIYDNKTMVQELKAAINMLSSDGCIVG